jgi:membrane protein required for colicin V production
MFRIVLLGGLNRVGGVLFGLLEGAFIVAMVLFVATSKPAPDKLKGYVNRAATAAPFLEAGREIVAGWGGLPDLLKKAPAGLTGKSPARE